MYKRQACGSKESDNDKKDVGSETKQDVFTYDLKGVTVAMNENMEPLVKKLGEDVYKRQHYSTLFS